MFSDSTFYVGMIYQDLIILFLPFFPHQDPQIMYQKQPLPATKTWKDCRLQNSNKSHENKKFETRGKLLFSTLNVIFYVGLNQSCVVFEKQKHIYIFLNYV